MKKRIISILSFLPILLLLAGCSQEMESVFNTSSREVTLTACMPSEEAATRVGLTQASASLDLIANWQNDDQLKVYVVQDDKMFEVGNVAVGNISYSGKQASFSFTLPSGVNVSKDYQVYAFCGIDGVVDKGSGNSWDVFCNMELKRTELSSLKAPLFGEAKMNTKSNGILQMRHFATYELLHVKNSSNTQISFRHVGFEVERPWYCASAGINFHSYEDNTNIPSEWDGDYESETVSIPAGGSACIISCYLPSGYKMQNAYLQASINGEMVTSTNKKSSDITIERAHAYHQYVTWDGKELKYDNGDITAEKIISIEPGTINFGTIDFGTSKTEQFVVSNMGNTDLTFCIESTHGVFDIADSGKDIILHVGEHKTINVLFTPLETNLLYSQNVFITSDAMNGTQVLKLSGQAEESRIGQVIPDEMREQMEPYIHIYDGSNPPNIEGDYLVSPAMLYYDSKTQLGLDYGYQFSDSYIRFLHQNMIQNTLDYEEKQGSSVSEGKGAFISGEGDKFSVFFNTESIIYRSGFNIYTKEALVISGIKTNDGIKDLEYAFVMVEKNNDLDDELMDVGAFRVIIDGDYISYFNPWSYIKGGMSKRNNVDISMPMILEKLKVKH